MELHALCFLLLLSGLSYARRDEYNGTVDWWQSTVVYQIYPRSFQDSDNDGIGDLKGITSRLDYIQSLGVETIWLSPIYKSPMKDFGYDISDFKSIAPIFGTMDDFDALANVVKNRDMKLVLDYVPNHSSDQHVWFNKSVNMEGKYTDYYIWMNGTGPNGTVPPNNWLQSFGGSAWEYMPERDQFYLHQFLVQQPDLNYRNPQVHEEVKDIWKFWLDKGIDGYRIDAHTHIYENISLPNEPRSGDKSATPFDYNYLDHIYTTCQPEIPDLLLEWREIFESYTAKDNEHRLMMLEGYCSPSQAVIYYGNATQPLADFPFNFQLNNINSNTTADQIVDLINQWLEPLPAFAWPNFVVGNHDIHRIASRMGSNNVDGINMMVLLLGGTAIIYNGDEIGMTDNMNITYKESQDPFGCNYGPKEYLKYSRDPERTPFQWDASPGTGFTNDTVTPWLPINENHVTINVENQETDPRSHLNVFRGLVRLRKDDSIQRGSIEFPYVSQQVMSFSRVKRGNDGYLVAINFSPNEETIDVTKDCCQDYSFPSNGTVVVVSSTSSRNVGDTVELNNLALGANEALVIQFAPNVK